MDTNLASRLARAGLFGAVLGGMTGFAAGLLVAPDEGQRTRRRLVYRLEHLALQASLFVEDLMHSKTTSEARRTSDALVADAQERAQRIRDDIDTLLEEMRQQDAAERSPSAD